LIRSYRKHSKKWVSTFQKGCLSISYTIPVTAFFTAKLHVKRPTCFTCGTHSNWFSQICFPGSCDPSNLKEGKKRKGGGGRGVKKKKINLNEFEKKKLLSYSAAD